MREKKQQTHAFDLRRWFWVIRQTKFYDIVFNLEQRLKRSNSHVHCYSISRFFSEWKRKSNKHTHLKLYSSYSSNKALQHRFQSRTKIQVIVFTCALLFDLALLFWMRERKQQIHAFDLRWCFWVIRRTKFYNIVFDLEQRLKRSYSHVHCYSISRFSSEWERKNNKHTQLFDLLLFFLMRETKQHTRDSIWNEKLKLFDKQNFITSLSVLNKDANDHTHMCIVIRFRASSLNARERQHTHYFDLRWEIEVVLRIKISISSKDRKLLFFFSIIVSFFSAKRETIIQRKR
jgi:hypothetical protein